MTGPTDAGQGPSRRAFLLGAAAFVAGCTGGGGSTTPVAGPVTTGSTGAARGPGRTGIDPTPAPDVPDLGPDPFGLGVASGDPLPDRVVFWTRLAPDPLAPDAGIAGALQDVDLTVVLDIADEPTDGGPGLGVLRHSEIVVARAAEAHTVHVDVAGLQPGRWYRYRFRYGATGSPIGRTRTAPPPDARPASWHVVAASCQHLEHGTYVAHRRIAEEPDLDLVVFLGDAIYEGGGTASETTGRTSAGRVHGPEARDLTTYRARYAQYRADPDLRAAHARAPWIVTWDDHEVENNYPGLSPADPADADAFPDRRAAAYRAWWEHQPVRLPPPAADGGLHVHRSFRWGRLAHIVVLDGRQYRSDQPCGDGVGRACDELDRPEATMLGTEQAAWVAEEFRRAAGDDVTWTVLANQTALTDMVVRLGVTALTLFDQWDGYPAARRALLGAARDAGVRLVALTGDLHATVVGDLVLDGDVVGTEFLGSSISTSFAAGGAAFELAMRTAPAVRFLDTANRGYARCTVDADRFRTDMRWVGDARDPAVAVRTGSSWIVERDVARVRTA